MLNFDKIGSHKIVLVYIGAVAKVYFFFDFHLNFQIIESIEKKMIAALDKSCYHGKCKFSKKCSVLWSAEKI